MCCVVEKPTFAARCRASKALLYIISHPLCNLNAIYDSGVVSKNWYEVKSTIETLVRCKLIQRANWWTVPVYFVRQYLEPEERITANHLLLKDEFFRVIKSKKMSDQLFNEFTSHYGLKSDISSMPKGIFEKELMHYQEGLDSKLSCREQILRKFVILYFQMVKIMLLRYRRDKEIDPRQARSNKDSREREIITFLLSFTDFVDSDDQGPFLSRRFRTYHEISNYLDDEFHDYLNYYKKLTQNAIQVKQVINTYYQTILQTKKDASENEEITMKQVSNRIRPYEKPDGAPDIAKMCREGQIESGMGLFYSPDEVVWLYDLYAIKEALRITPNGQEHDRIRKDAEMMFTGITFD